jgi:hypothetical protein
MAISESATLQTAKLFINHCSSLAIAMIDADAPDPAVSSKKVEISWMRIRVRHDNAQAARSFLPGYIGAYAPFFKGNVAVARFCAPIWPTYYTRVGGYYYKI